MTPSVGRIVHYVNDGKHQSAIITEVIRSSVPSIASLCVFAPTGVYFVEAIDHSDEPFDETWHYPERV